MGESITIDEMSISRARNFARLLDGGVCPYSELMLCFRTSESEGLVFQVQPSIPQFAAADIRRTEHIKVEFREQDTWYPTISALRLDFPRANTLHLNLNHADEPASLCLFDQPWHEVKLTLTSEQLLFRIQTWLNDTAAGKLHREDQALEPMYLSAAGQIILSPVHFEEHTSPTPISLNQFHSPEGELVLIDSPPQKDVSQTFAFKFVSTPHNHDQIHLLPKNLSELSQHMLPVGIDILQQLRVRLYQLGESAKLLKFLVLLFVLRRQRSPESPAINWPVAFQCLPPAGDDLRSLPAALGLANEQITSDHNGSNVPVLPLRVRKRLTPTSAAVFGGLQSSDQTVAAIGVGALGSQIVTSCVKEGLTKWALVDPDIMLPHNLVRHALSGFSLGFSKAEALSMSLNSCFSTQQVTACPANVLAPGRYASEVQAILQTADAIVDISASIAVARYLAVDAVSAAPRCSIFLSPSGKDLIFLGEDAQRIHRLDQLEAQYYAAIIAQPEFDGHLLNGQVGGSCREPTSLVPQRFLGLHSAIASSILRDWIDQKSPTIVIARATEECVRRFSVSPLPSIQVGILKGWTVVATAQLLSQVSKHRADWLPNETGGVLLAQIDAQRKVVYVCHQLEAPDDSERKPASFVRNTGLKDDYDRVHDKALGNLVYVGEWHSHPNGAGAIPSKLDLEAGHVLAEIADQEIPCLMLIACERSVFNWLAFTNDKPAGAPDSQIITWSGGSDQSAQYK